VSKEWRFRPASEGQEGPPAFSRYIVRRSEGRELCEQIGVGFQAVSLHSSIRDHRKEIRLNVIGKRPAVGWIRWRAPGLIRQHVGQ
jgi:hypothetical protein